MVICICKKNLLSKPEQLASGNKTEIITSPNLAATTFCLYQILMQYFAQYRFLHSTPIVFLIAIGFCLLSPVITSAFFQKHYVDQYNAPKSLPLKPFKDNRFSYRKPLEIRDGGDFLIAPYNEMRDINKRDEIPVRKVKSSYIKRIPSAKVHDFFYESPNGSIAVYGIGRVSGNATMSVVYLHGRDGNRKWGFDDERFGGNYNRLKNLLLAGGGAYLSPDFSDFEDKGVADIAALLKRQRQTTKGALVLACGSMGAKICWQILANNETANLVDGLVFLGSFPDPRLLALNRKNAHRPPIYIAHGSRDKVYKAEAMRQFYAQLRQKNHPVRMVVFDSGNHGTPVRMIDWRQALNWIAAKARR